MDTTECKGVRQSEICTKQMSGQMAKPVPSASFTLLRRNFYRITHPTADSRNIFNSKYLSEELKGEVYKGPCLAYFTRGT